MRIGQGLPLPMFSDMDTGGQAPPEAPAIGGQGVEPAPETPAEGTGQAPFHTYTNDAGEDQHFANADELNKFIRSGTMIRSNYTQKTQDLARMRKDYESRSSQLNGRSEQLLASEAKLKGISDFLRDRPDVYQRILNESKGGMPPDVAMQQSINPLQEQMKAMEERLGKFDEAEARRTADGKKDAAFALAAEKLPGFDKKAVELMMTELQNSPEGDEMFQFLNILHDVVQHRRIPAPAAPLLGGDPPPAASPRSRGGSSAGAKTAKKEADSFAEAGELTKRAVGVV